MRRLLAPSLLVAVLAVTPLASSSAAVSAAPRPEPGWRLVFRDDFSGSRLGRIWGAYDAPHGGPAASYYTPSQVSVSGGLLRLGIADQPSGGRRYATGAVGGWGLPQTYGRYEFRAKAPLGRGMDAYITLWPKSQAPQQAALVEVLARPGAEKAYLSNEYGSGETNSVVPGRYSDAFHTYVIEWAPGWFRILVDGRVRMSDTHVSREKRTIAFALSSGDPLTGPPDASTRIPNAFLVDWVRIYAYDPAAGAAVSDQDRASPSPSAPAATGRATKPPEVAAASAPRTTAPPRSAPPVTVTVRGDGASVVYPARASSSYRWLLPVTGALALLLVAAVAVGAARARRSRRRPAHSR